MTTQQPISPASLLATATQHHQAGRLAEAEQGYRLLLAAEANNAAALHGLALLDWQAGRLDAALLQLQQVALLAPNDWRYAFTLGQLAAVMRRWDDAIPALERASEVRPELAAVWHSLAGALHGAGRLPTAVVAYQKAQACAPNQVDISNDLGVALDAQGRHHEAVSVLCEALKRQADYLPLYNNLGNALAHARLFDAAVDVLREGVNRSPGSAELWFNLGNALAARGISDAVVEAYRQAIALQSDHKRAWVALGNALRARGDQEGAARHYQQAMALDGGDVDALNNLGVTLLSLGRLDEAIDALRHAVQCDPQCSVAYNNLGNALKDAGRLDDALAAYRQAMALDPTDTQPHSNLLYTLSFHPDFDESAILREARHWADAHDRFPALGHASHDATPNRRLRIGYVSPDFREHCQALFTRPLLAHHDHTAVEIYCYANLAVPDVVSAEIARYADVWRSIYGLTDDEVAATVMADQIDILVDLTMHMANARPLLFARKPAPVQLAWLAYPGTTGLPAIDYRLTDPWLDPVEQADSRYTEASVRLPETFWCYAPIRETPAANALPAISNGFITFGCLNNFCKVSDASLVLWASVLTELPNSRLILLAAEGAHRNRVYQHFAAAGIASERIEFLPFQSRPRYLETYHRIDICLDTLPYNGHTTSLDAYWMGVPVVTRVGDTVVGRAGWSQLNNLGLPELAAFDDGEFQRIALSLAQDLDALSGLRQSLRERMRASPLMDGSRFARGMEAGYRDVWQRWCDSQAG